MKTRKKNQQQVMKFQTRLHNNVLLHRMDQLFLLYFISHIYFLFYSLCTNNFLPIYFMDPHPTRRHVCLIDSSYRCAIYWSKETAVVT